MHNRGRTTPHTIGTNPTGTHENTECAGTMGEWVNERKEEGLPYEREEEGTVNRLRRD